MSSYTARQYRLTDAPWDDGETSAVGRFHCGSTMNLVHPHVSAMTPQRTARRRVLEATMLMTGLACMQPGLCADNESNVATIVSDNIASVQRRPSGTLSVTVTPEVSAVRTRLAPAAAAPLAADGRPLSELAGVNYTLWMSHGRADVGVGVGTLGYVVPRPDGRIEGPMTLTGASPTVNLGVRYRFTRDSAVFADASGTRGLGIDQSSNYLNTKVGVEWKPAKQTLGFEHGAIGMHFDSGYKLSLKARRGGLGLYLRGQF